MRRENLVTKTKLSELAGIPEATGRRYIADFQSYFPTIQKKIIHSIQKNLFLL
ncbi:hypothetical protein [Bacillus methanolicus]|uniref:hypothetical protein n=1 Tax=Bacillus methanolicus TaxID=1471 RepID=UPI0020100CF2|nr:hypothetical protein [Bacillus methanolicus]